MNGWRCGTYIHNGILLFRHKKEQNNTICRNMDIARDYHTKQSKSNKYHTKTLTCGISNMTQMNLSMQQK